MKKYVYGDSIGNSTFIEYTDQRLSGEVVSKFRCSCGKIFYAVCRRLKKRKILAGCKDCLNKKLLEKRAAVKTKHGMCFSAEYSSWSSIKSRCFNKNDHKYESYGAIGITMCEEFRRDFSAFLSHIGAMPTDGLNYSVDRIDNDLGYIRGNIRWATAAQQARNRSKVRANTSGTTGVIVEKYKGENYYWTAIWNDLEGKQHHARYSIRKYGEDFARFIAEEKRDLEIRKLNSIGAGYSDKHGMDKETNNGML